MGRLVYDMNASLDGYIEDRSGSFGFTEPDEEFLRAANDRSRSAAAFLFGRRLYEVMEDHWTGMAASGEGPDLELDFARLYVARPRIVFSDTLESVPEGVTLVRSHEARAEVERLKAEVDGVLAVGGATLAASLGDLIDEVRLFLLPVVVGGGKPVLPVTDPLSLRLVEHRILGSGAVYLRYERVR